MSKQRASADTPACYATVMPGLEPVAAEEVERTLGAEVKRTGKGVVVFRVPTIDRSLLELRTTEDVFLLAWGTDQLTLRAVDLEHIRRWTERSADWNRLLQLHHGVHVKPKGKPGYRLVTQMSGEHGYLRRDARRALSEGLVGKLPTSWRHVDENAAVEVWLTIDGPTAVCGLRLSDRTMRHRTYKLEHLPASLRPTLAAAMVRLAEARPGHVVVDPMCGAGTLLAEQLAVAWSGATDKPLVIWGGDRDRTALNCAEFNLTRIGKPALVRWDATHLPLAGASVDRIISNPPFGVQLGEPEEIGPLYRAMTTEYDRVLRPQGRVVILAADAAAVREAAGAVGWKRLRELRVRVLGQPAVISVWLKTAPED
jgi:tRNA (guanine6-N2)-methyltransferase